MLRRCGSILPNSQLKKGNTEMVKSMRGVLLGFGLAAAVALGGCSGGGTLPSVTTSEVQQTIDQVKAGAIKVCGYAPAFQTVLNIIGTFATQVAPISQSVDAIVSGICGAVTAKGVTLRGGATEPVFRGIKIEGQFVR